MPASRAIAVCCVPVTYCAAMSGPRVLHVAQPVDGGVGAYVASLARDQVRRGWDVHVACPPAGQLPQALAAVPATHEHWPAGRQPGPGGPAEVARLAAVLRRVQPDVVHLHSSKAGLVGRLVLRRRLPTLFQPHGWSWLAVTGAVATASRAWERGGSRWATATVCVSQGERREAVAAGVGGDLRVIRNGVDLDRFAKAPDGEARAALGIAADVPVAVCVGRLCRQKGQVRLLSAWPAVLRSVPQARLLLVGDGPDARVLEQVLPPHAALLGARSDVPALLAAANVVVLPSRWEGLSLTLLEALAAGRSVVTTAVAGSEVVPPDCGAVLPAGPEDDPAVVEQLVQALTVRLGSALAGQEGRRAAGYAREHLSLGVTFEALAELTLTAAGAHR